MFSQNFCRNMACQEGLGLSLYAWPGLSYPCWILPASIFFLLSRISTVLLLGLDFKFGFYRILRFISSMKSSCCWSVRAAILGWINIHCTGAFHRLLDALRELCLRVVKRRPWTSSINRNSLDACRNIALCPSHWPLSLGINRLSFVRRFQPFLGFSSRINSHIFLCMASLGYNHGLLCLVHSFSNLNKTSRRLRVHFQI